MLDWARQMRAMGIVGLNERNLDYINAHNRRTRFPLVDDKLRTKLLARRHRVATPELLGVIRTHSDIRQLEKMVAGVEGFVIKPSRGSSGKGILVIHSHENGWFLKGSGEWLPRHRVVRYLSNLLSGLYTLSGSPDVAMIEALIETEPHLADFSFAGVPDIRIVVYLGYPVMAMMRLSTSSSDGKANLHQGAIGVGLDLARGEPVHSIQNNRPVRAHPDTGRPLDELRIGNWSELLVHAAHSHEMTGLGYLGADMVLDRNRGPLLLELNARPGLSIQIANGSGLASRFALVHEREQERERRERLSYSTEERVAYMQRMVAGERQPADAVIAPRGHP